MRATRSTSVTDLRFQHKTLTAGAIRRTASSSLLRQKSRPLILHLETALGKETRCLDSTVEIKREQVFCSAATLHSTSNDLPDTPWSEAEITLEQTLASRQASYEAILNAYLPELQASSLSVGRDELSAYNKYHFCVRWYRLQGALADVCCVTSSIANYFPQVLRSICDTSLFLCQHDMSLWTRAEFGLATIFVQKHNIGRPKGISGDAGNPKSYHDLQICLILTLCYWLQKLDDHNLLDYPAYKDFTRWSLSMCRSFFRQGAKSGCPLAAVSSLKCLLPLEPVKAINTLYTMQRFGICPSDTTAVALWQAFDSEWMHILKRFPMRLKEYFYGLTHFILNESNFYQDAVHLSTRIDPLQDVLNGILDYFNKRCSDILAFCDPDLAGEVALCYLLCNREYREDWECCGSCIALIETCLQVDHSAMAARQPVKYVFRNCHSPGAMARGLKIEEHTNAVCLLALGFWVQRASLKRCIALVCYKGPHFLHDEWRIFCKSGRKRSENVTSKGKLA